MANIYELLKKYNKIKNEQEQHKFLISLDTNTRKSLKSFIDFAQDPKRYSNMYDDWVENSEDELIILSAYSFVIENIDQLNLICVDDKSKAEFDEAQKKMLEILIDNNQYYDAASTLNIKMYDSTYKEQKRQELENEVIKYFKQHKLALHKKVAQQLFVWINERRFTSYMFEGMDSKMKFELHEPSVDVESLAKSIEIAIGLKPKKRSEIIETLIKERRLET